MSSAALAAATSPFWETTSVTKRPWIWLVGGLVLVLAGAAVLGWVLLFPVVPGAESTEDRAVKAVEQWHGRVTRDEQKEGKPVVGVDLAGTKVTDAGLKELKDLPSVQTLNLSDTQVTAAGLKELAAFKQLQSLSLAPV